MLTFLFKRFIQALMVVLAISAVGFLLQGALGDPVQQLLGAGASEAERAALREAMGLNDPLWLQYLHFACNALQLDFGDSTFFHQPTLSIIARYLPATAELIFASAVLTLLLSFPIGIYAAIRPTAALSRFFLGISVLGISVPVFLTAIGLIQFFSIGVSVTLFPDATPWGHWLNDLLSTRGGMPAYGRGNPEHVLGVWYTNFASWKGLSYIALPALSLASVMLPLFVRLIRAEMVEILASDYVRFARAKGLTPARIYTVHALKNALLPVITLGGMQFGSLLAYTLLTETVFQWPGLGLMFLDAVERADMPLITTCLMVAGFFFVVINTLIDLTYRLLNPRIALEVEPR